MESPEEVPDMEEDVIYKKIIYILNGKNSGGHVITKIIEQLSSAKDVRYYAHLDIVANQGMTHLGPSLMPKCDDIEDAFSKFNAHANIMVQQYKDLANTPKILVPGGPK